MKRVRAAGGTRAGKAGASGAEGAPQAAGSVKRRQAVVVVHGMGEQRPMSTLRDFVDAVWVRDPSINAAAGHPNATRIWITPDERTGSHELRRVVTSYVRDIRTDFYELYWADLIRDTTRARLFAWLRELLWRDRADIPHDARRLYRATAAIAAVLAVLAVLVALSAFLHPVAAIVISLLSALALWVVDHFALPYFGDVASYVQATPETVAQRKAVRERGLHLIRRLSDDPDYDRIVLVGHSLGSVIAYDLLQLFWHERRPRGLTFPRDRVLTNAIRAVGEFALLPGAAPPVSGDLAGLRAAQWRLYELLRHGSAARPSWKISDFVTLGSPLTHAEFLIARNEAALRKGIAERLFATCPPQSDQAGSPEIMYYSEPRMRAVHHGAAFAATRWTNIFDRGNLLWSGDPISGPLRGNFGWGIEEVRLVLRRRNARLGERLFTHTLYWSAGATAGRVEADVLTGAGQAHLDALREALDLMRRQEDRA